MASHVLMIAREPVRERALADAAQHAKAAAVLVAQARVNLGVDHNVRILVLGVVQELVLTQPSTMFEFEVEGGNK